MDNNLHYLHWPCKLTFLKHITRNRVGGMRGWVMSGDSYPSSSRFYFDINDLFKLEYIFYTKCLWHKPNVFNMISLFFISYLTTKVKVLDSMSVQCLIALCAVLLQWPNDTCVLACLCTPSLPHSAITRKGWWVWIHQCCCYWISCPAPDPPRPLHASCRSTRSDGCWRGEPLLLPS